MANPEHLKILKQGVRVWNEWREDNINVRPDLRGAYLIRAHLSDAYLRGANLRIANLSDADLSGVDLMGADLGGANLIRADLSYADLNAAYLRGADLSDADLGGAVVKRSIVKGAVFTASIMGDTALVDIDLSEAKGLETVKHLAPSAIGIDTLYKSAGKIPEVFLRGCGVPEDFITYMRSLTVQPIQFYTCFISFTEADDAFSERLYNDFQAKGVRCW